MTDPRAEVAIKALSVSVDTHDDLAKVAREYLVAYLSDDELGVEDSEERMLKPQDFPTVLRGIAEWCEVTEIKPIELDQGSVESPVFMLKMIAKRLDAVI